MKDFTKLDNAIMDRIGMGECSFTSISACVEHIATPLATRPGQAFRVVDRRLQALRKRGMIYFEKAKWRLGASLCTADRTAKT